MSDKDTQTSGNDQGDKGTPTPTTTPKMVPESDLIAVKKGLEKELTEARAEGEKSTTELNTQLADVRQQLLQEQAAKEQLDTQLKSSISKDDMGKVVAAKEAAEKRSEELETKLLDLRKQSLVATYKVPMETLKDKTNEQLDFMEIALKAAGGGSAAKSFDLGGGAGGVVPTTPLDRAKATIAEAMEKRGIKTTD